MNRIATIGRLLYGIAIILLGIEQFITGNFPAGLLPVPASLPGRLVLVYGIGALLIACGAGIATKKRISTAATTLGWVLLLLGVWLHVPTLLNKPGNGGAWTVLFELVALAGGAFSIAGQFSFMSPFDTLNGPANRLITWSRILVAVSLLVFAVLHFVYAQYIATLIPTWIPGRLFWAYFVGIAFVATAISLLSQRQVSLTTQLLGLMFFLWVVILHAPRVVANPRVEPEWTSLGIALAMSGVALALARRAPPRQLLLE